MDEIETIRIVKHNGRTGYAIINKADFDPERHEVYEDDAGPAGDAPMTFSTDAPRRGRRPKGGES